MKIRPGVISDFGHASCSDVVDGLLRRIRNVRVAVPKASRTLDVRAVSGRTAGEEIQRGQAADQRLRPSSPRILGYWSGSSSLEALVRPKQNPSFQPRLPSGMAVASIRLKK